MPAGVRNVTSVESQCPQPRPGNPILAFWVACGFVVGAILGGFIGSGLHAMGFGIALGIPIGVVIGAQIGKVRSAPE